MINLWKFSKFLVWLKIMQKFQIRGRAVVADLNVWVRKINSINKIFHKLNKYNNCEGYKVFYCEKCDSTYRWFVKGSLIIILNAKSIILLGKSIFKYFSFSLKYHVRLSLLSCHPKESGTGKPSQKTSQSFFQQFSRK